MTDAASPTPIPAVEGREPLLRISTGVVAVHKRCRGRGPTKVRVHWDDDIVTVLMRGDLTLVERTLAAAGQWAAVAEQRAAYEAVIGPELIAVVEAATGRAVEAFLHRGHYDPDVHVETFVLAHAQRA